jgi:hypothetical protein
MFQVIQIHFLLIFTESKTFQQMGQTISQVDSDSTDNHFSRETEMFLIHSESGTVPNTPLVEMQTIFQFVVRKSVYIYNINL